MGSHPPRYGILITHSAEADLEGIYDYLVEPQSLACANRVLDQLMKVVEELAHFPNRGHHPVELLDMGTRQYRQVAFKPYRVIYEVREKQVIVRVVADGRRNMQALLFRRLIEM